MTFLAQLLFFDNIHITGRTHEDHQQNLEVVLQRLDNAGLRLKRRKCVFYQKKVSYLGYKLNPEDQHLLDDKVEATQKAPTPTDICQLRSVLGLVSFYCKYLPIKPAVCHGLSSSAPSQ